MYNAGARGDLQLLLWDLRGTSESLVPHVLQLTGLPSKTNSATKTISSIS